MNGKEELSLLHNFALLGCKDYEKDQVNKCFDIIEKDLDKGEKAKEVLEIIIKKQVHIARVNKCDNVLQYNMGTTHEERYLTETEFNKFKEAVSQ